MITIDNDRNWIGLIQQKQNQLDAMDGKKSSPDGLIKQSGETQLVDLLSLVNKSPDMTVATERLVQLRSDINSNTYSIDLDRLVDNILASDHG